MNRQLCSLAFSALLGMGVAMAAPQEQNPAPAPNAAPAPHRQMDPDHQLKMLTKHLNLTDDQQKQILPILTDRQQQFESIRNDSSLAPKDRREKMRTLREDSETKIKAVLNDDQKQKYDEMQKQMRERMQQHRQEANPAPSSN